MAITNREIIASACALYGITEPVKTLPQWNRLGFKVKKGQHALFTAKIWKPTKKVTAKIVPVDDENEEEVEPKSKPKKQRKQKTMILVNAGFFGYSQVTKVES